MLRIDESEKYPWWRTWRYSHIHDSKDVLIMPLCWLARAAWKLWCFSFKVRPTAWERELRKARRAGFEDGIAKKNEMHRKITDDLLARIIVLRTSVGGGSATPNTELR